MIRTEPADPKPKSRGIQDMALRRVDIFRMDPRSIRIAPGFNVRVKDFDPEDDEDLTLAKSIAENGVKSALTVFMKDGEPTLTDGHRRLRAALYAIDVLGAQVQSVPVQTETRGADEIDRVLSMETRNGGKQLQPIERAAIYSRLIGLGLDEGQIATRVGRTRQYINNLLSLREGPTEVVKMVEAGEVSATLAMQTLRDTGGDGAAATAKLSKARDAAQAQGKTRATAKHVERDAVTDLTKHPAYAAGLRAGLSRAAEIVRAQVEDDALCGQILSAIEA